MLRSNAPSAYFKAAHELKPELEARYAASRPGRTRQLHFSPRSERWLGSQWEKRHDKSGKVSYVTPEVSTLDIGHEEENNDGLA